MSPAQSGDTPITVIGAKRARLGDLHHRFLRAPWWVALTGIVIVFLGLNGVFAAIYAVSGGVQGATGASFLDYFSFSVHTMATIGYGSMYPVSSVAQLLVIAEAVIGLLVTALVTGLVFSKFSHTAGRMVFSRRATISPMDGKPTLLFRLGNERGNQIVEAVVRLTLVRTEWTLEGQQFYRMYDLKLVRERSAAVSRSFTVMHVIDETSLLYGLTPDDLRRHEVELLVSLVGTDDTSLQPVHARHTYTDRDIVFGARHVDILSEGPNGSLVLDVTRFHELTPTDPIEGFPYRASPDAWTSGSSAREAM
ncbi:MAG: ion channel [Polyangiaceae bacterium]